MLITEDLMAPAADAGVQLHVPVRHWIRVNLFSENSVGRQVYRLPTRFGIRVGTKACPPYRH